MFSSMMQESKMMQCEDFTFSVVADTVTVQDHAEGEVYSMTLTEIVNVMAERMIEDQPGQSSRVSRLIAADILENATPSGIAEFVYNCCDC